MILEDVAGFSLFEKTQYVTRENVWGDCLWKAWQAKGYSAEDLFYIFRIYQLIPERVHFETFPARNSLTDQLYDDYILQVSTIKEYLFTQVKNGTLDRANWLKNLYLEKGWGFVRTNAFAEDDFIFNSEEILWEGVVTNELRAYLDTFNYKKGKTQFEIEFLLQRFPDEYNDALFAPTIKITNFDNMSLCSITTQDGFKFEKQYDNRDAIMQGLKNGDFATAYFDKGKPKVVVVAESDTVLETPTEGYTIVGFRFARGYQRMIRITDNNGQTCDVTDANLKKQIQSGVTIKGVILNDKGGLLFPDGLKPL